MKIAISGAHAQGKTTLVNALQQHEMFKDYVFKTNLTRSLKEAGLNINEAGDAVTQLAVMSKHFEYANLPSNVILDRCALDGLAYSRVLLRDLDDTEFKVALFTIGCRCLNQYDIIFYVKPELPLVSDGTRSVDQDFFNKVVDSFEYTIDNISTFNKPVTIVEISGSVEERVDLIVSSLKLLNINSN